MRIVCIIFKIRTRPVFMIIRYAAAANINGFDENIISQIDSKWIKSKGLNFFNLEIVFSPK